MHFEYNYYRCELDYSGDYCDTAEPKGTPTNLVMIIAVSVGCFVALIIVIGVIIAIRNKMQKNKVKNLGKYLKQF